MMKEAAQAAGASAPGGRRQKASAIVERERQTQDDDRARRDDPADFDTDAVDEMSEESFPASDPAPPPSSIGPDWDEQ